TTQPTQTSAFNSYRPPAPGGQTATTPVVTSNAAQTDYTAKLNALKNLTAQMQAQRDIRANQATAISAAKAQADLVQSELNLKQQGIDIQRQQAESTNAIAESRRRALEILNGNQEVPPTGTETPNPPQPTAQPTTQNNIQNNPPTNFGGTTNPITTGLNDTTSQYLSAQNLIQQQKDAIAEQFNPILQGTIPLTPSQQALITSLQTQLAQSVATQTQVNASYTGAVTEAAFRSGGEYTPAEMAGRVQMAVSDGIQKIQNLDNSAASTIAKLENDFQTQNYDRINKNYDTLMKQLDDKSQAIKDTYDTTIKALQDQRDFEYKSAQDAIKNGMDLERLNLDQSKFTEEQRKNLVDEQIARENEAKGRYMLKDNPDGTQSVFDTRTGKIIQDRGNALTDVSLSFSADGSFTTGIPLVDNNLKVSVSGLPFVDGTNLKGAQAEAVQLQAARLGLTYLSAAGADAIANTDTARQDMTNILDTGGRVLPSAGVD